MFLKKKCSSLILFTIIAFSACKENKQKVDDTFNAYQFDKNVIANLPKYDQLVSTIFQNQHILTQYSEQDGGTHGFRFMPLSTDAEVYKKLPPEVEHSIGPAFKMLGDNLIAGFDLFPDSSIRIYIRRSELPKSTINIDEYLSYFPAGKNIRTRQFPEKDSVLNPHWQYWIRVNDEGIF